MNENINTWWEGIPEERYWLGVIDRGCRSDLLAAPRPDGRHSASWSQRLVNHVKDGDLVFHYDAGERAIVASSVARGQVHERPLMWNGLGESADPAASPLTRASWAIELEQPNHLNPGVPIHEIARVQWELFPALRDLEDKVGDPLYYPFEMGNRFASKPLPGYVFKLPAVFVRSISALATVAEHARGSVTTLRVANSATASPRAATGLVGALLRLAR